MESIVGASASPRRLAKTAGGLYLINIVFGAFAIGLVPVLLGSGPDAGAVPAAQLQALAHLPGDLSPIGSSIYTVFYGFDVGIVAYLVLKSTLLPRTAGVLLAVDSVAYLVDAFTNLLAPGVAAHLAPWINLPALVGEGSLCVWLLVAGVNVERWTQWAGAAERSVRRGAAGTLVSGPARTFRKSEC